MVEAPTQAEVTPGFRDSDSAPFVYFDTTATFGVLAGVIQIELVSRTLVPTTDGGVKREFRVTGRLRCSPAAARYLREAIDKTLDMVTKEQEGAPATAVQANKLN
jgi:hypothetical protein